MIDVKEAIIRLKKGFLVDCKGDTTNKDFEALNAAIKALEKQIPKKVLNIQGDKLKFGTCPCCGRRISTVEGGNYCQNCGKAIDWSCEE